MRMNNRIRYIEIPDGNPGIVNPGLTGIRVHARRTKFAAFPDLVPDLTDCKFRIQKKQKYT